ncbi:hypothetical protein [Brachybacterium sacelli]|uniref:hypothetical protein n=1 Tax=Brachybacterium sacelli TaxID=173364 RepID=UPI003614555F
MVTRSSNDLEKCILATSPQGPGIREDALTDTLVLPAPRRLLSELGQFSPVGSEDVNLHASDDEDNRCESIKRLCEAH